jgi:tRNA (mo5U34)-methyltransferase
MAFIEGNFAGDPTNWWVPNKSGTRSMLRSCGLKIIVEPEDEIYLGEATTTAGVISPFAEADYRAAVGTR